MFLPKQRRTEQGIALVTALLMLLLLSSLSVGFILLVTSEQQSNGLDRDHTKTFYAAYGAMEQVNAQVGTLFSYNPQHVTGTDITQAINTLPNLPGYNLVDPANPTFCPSGDYTGTSNGYCVSYQKDANGNPLAQTRLITQGPYQGFQGLVTDYTITVNVQSQNFSLTTDEAGNTGTNRFGSEIRLRRTFQTVAIPVFQFGIFSQTDLSFFPGPNFNFGGKVATNGDIYLAGGSNLVLSDKVSAYGDVIRDRLSNGYSGSNYTSNYAGAVYPTTSPAGSFTGTPPPPVPPYRSLAFTDGSINGGPSGGCNTTNGQPLNGGVTPNSNWTTVSLSNYNGNLRDGAYGCPRGTGAKNLQLPLLSPNAVAQGATALALIKEPPSSENPATSPIFPYRFFAYPTGASYAMLRIMIADTPGEILAEPTVSGPVGNAGWPQPLFCLPPTPPATATCTSLADTTYYAGTVNIVTNTGSGTATSLPISGGVPGVPNSPATLPPWAAAYGTPTTAALSGVGSTTLNINGDWYKAGQPRLWGYIKIEYQDGSTGGNWTDVTTEILSLGTTGRNLSTGTWLSPSAGAPSGGTTAPACREPYPNAVIRIQRMTDVPSNRATYTCGYPALGFGANGPTAISNVASDYIPLMLYDTREGLLRDYTSAPPFAPNLTMNGVMYYVELDATNLARWFTGAIGTSGRPAAGVSGYLVYFSDRRSNQPCSPTANCPGNISQKVGNLGFEDFVNPASATSLPNGIVDKGEDLNGANATLPGASPVSMPLDKYGATPVFNKYPLSLSSPNSTLAPYSLPTVPDTTRIQCSGTPTAPNLQCPSTSGSSYSSGSSPSLFNLTGGNAPYNTVTIAEARTNPALFFRRALKITNGQAFNLGNCGTSIPCGLTIASENPVYVEGNYNSGGATLFTGTDYPSSIIADAITLLSVNWNDINSYRHPYDLTTSGGVADPGRGGNTTYYRMAVLAGKGLSFPQPTVGVSPQDFGTDGGVHNFLRYIESWGGTLNYRGSIASFYFNEQAVGTFKCCSTVYSPPTRGYSFNTNYLTPTLLPPRTPAFTDTNTLGFTQLILPGQN